MTALSPKANLVIGAGFVALDGKADGRCRRETPKMRLKVAMIFGSLWFAEMKLSEPLRCGRFNAWVYGADALVWLGACSHRQSEREQRLRSLSRLANLFVMAFRRSALSAECRVLFLFLPCRTHSGLNH